MADDFVWNRSGLAQIDRLIAKDLERRATRVEAAAKRLCPVDTGRLRASITHETDVDQLGPVARVGTNVTYGIYVEIGTSRAKRQPFLRPALGAAR